MAVPHAVSITSFPVNHMPLPLFCIPRFTVSPGSFGTEFCDTLAKSEVDKVKVRLIHGDCWYLHNYIMVFTSV